MAILTLNPAHASALAQATGEQFNLGSVRVLTGAPPGAGAVETGTLLATLAVPDPAFVLASDGVVESASAWSGTAAVTGAPGYFRLQDANDLQIREGDAAESPGTGQVMLFSGLVGGDLVAGGVVTIQQGAYTLAQPSS